MRETWEAPSIAVQQFMPGEYALQACYDYKVQLQCAIPGKDPNHVADGNYGDVHGICGDLSTVIDVSGKVGYETVGGVADPLRPITNIYIGKEVADVNNDGLVNDYDLSNTTFTNNAGTNNGLTNNGWYHATWDSQDNRNGQGRIYHHWGLAIVSAVEQILGRPNHS